jgi:NADH/NAD ratio-sensing transcriptional regulator Rex
MKNLSRILSAEELARILNVNEITVRKLAREKQIPCRLVKKRYGFDLKEMIRFFKKLEGGAA